MATYRVTPAGAGDKGGSTWANAMDYAAWETKVEGDVAAGDIFYVRPEQDGGGFTLTSDFTPAVSGTITAPIKVIGVKKETTNENPVFSDWAYGDDRPLITGGAYGFGRGLTADYWHYYNLRVTGTLEPVLYIYRYGVVFNCKAHNINNSSPRYTFRYDNGSKILLCEFISNLSGAISGYEGDIAYCYIHDSASGIGSLSDRVNITNCIIANCSNLGIDINTRSNVRVKNCTIYNCGTGISGTTGGYGTFINNIISNCTTGANWTTATPSNFWAHNCFYNTTNRNGVDAGLNDIEADPKLHDPSNDDFTLNSDSPCLDAGMQLTVNQGLPAGTEYKVNIGADQDDVTAGGGGGATSYGFVQ